MGWLKSHPAVSALRPLVYAAPLALAACVGGHNPAVDLSGTVRHPEECAPYARARTGLALSGEAYQWWDQAAGRYVRSSVPRVGAALVFQRSDRLPRGHVAVVAQIVSAREILVDQANWVHGRISHNDQVWDVSLDNDWTLVRVWWRPAVSLGVTIYPAYGFVGPAGAALSALGFGTNRSLQDGGTSAICAPSWTIRTAPVAG